MLARDQLGQRREHRLAPCVFADGDELHLRRDDAPTRIVHLGDVGTRAVDPCSAARLALEIETHPGQGRIDQPLAAVRRGRAVELDGIAALSDPVRAERRQASTNVDANARIRIRTGGVVDDDRRVRFDAERGRRVALHNFAHGHANIRPQALDEDLPRIGKRLHRRVVDMRVAGEESVVGVHCAPLERRSGGAGAVREHTGQARFPAPALSAQVPRV